MPAPSLYRRHRPRTFADVVGQEHVVRTLRNAVEQGKVHHAYLFVGSRGTGKTSMAKILAACLNCERGPTVEPCGACDSCVAIANATSLDVIEMDAASNNSVEDVRELREKVAYAPVSGRHKVYILDEAHMLSSQAWNAFLKTLEEPPPNTIFVLATTEAQKVLPTVVDRCHRFDFHRPSVAEIVSVLRRAVEAEGADVPDQALALVARSATGSFRDALGTLEQLLVYRGTDGEGAQVELDDVLAVLGVADVELLFEATEAVAEHDPRRALAAVERLADSGRDVGQFYKDLEGHLRQLLVVQVLGEVPEPLRTTDDQDARLAEQAGRVAEADVVRLLDGLAAALTAIRDGANPRIQLELALVKAASPRLEPSTRALMARVEQLEARLGAGAGAGGDPGPPPPAPAPPRGGGPSAVAVAAVAMSEGEPVAEAVTAVAVAEPGPGASPLDVESLRAAWPAVLEAVQAENAMIAAALAKARCTDCDEDTITVAFPRSDTFFKKKAEDRANKTLIAGALREVTGRSLRLDFELCDDAEGAEPAGAVSGDEIFQRFLREFEGEEIFDDEQGGG